MNTVAFYFEIKILRVFMYTHFFMCALNISFFRRNKKTGNLVTPSLTFLASGHFCHLLIIFANSLDPDHDRQNVGPDLDPNCLTL